MRKFISKWQELIVWIPAWAAAAIILYWVLPELDPRAGVDGLGFLSGIVESGLLVSVIFFFTWLYRETYGLADETARKENADKVRQDYPAIFYVFELLKQLAVLIVVYLCLKH